MAGGSVTSGVSTFSGTLTAATVDTIQFADRYGYVLVQNTGTTVLYATADGTTPSTTVGAATGVAVAPGGQVVLANGLVTWYQSSKVIPAGAPLLPRGGSATVATSSSVTTTPFNPGNEQPYMSSGYGQASNPGTTVKLISTATPSYTVSGTG